MADPSISRNPTLMDWKNTLDPDGTIAQVIELLTQTNEHLLDIPWMEGNLTTGHRTVVRSGLPQGTWRMLYQFVQPTKASRGQVTDTCGMLEAFMESCLLYTSPSPRDS